ncbi:protein cereblon, partial [Hyalella azteca]|uniref:Protein cereblon n=1 Tax=Hyalella azteca TaxID=294128 RepID=A0A8B7NLL6_HYAAZ
VPSWVLQRTDVYRLAASVRQYLLVLGSEAAQVPESPVSLCEYACLNVPLPDHHRRYLLHLHCYHQRLMYLLHLQEQWTSLGCVHCEALVARREDLLIVSSDGQQSAYVNPGGFVHEIITVRTTDRLYLLGAPTPEHSWFPGYAWTIATCSGCRRHVGWKFTAVRPNLRPKKFYGLTRTAVMPV